MTRSLPLFLTSLLVASLALGTLGCSKKDENNTNNDTSTSCERGEQGCACDTGSLCGLSAGGAQLACVAGVCDAAPCEPGSAGCACDAAGACGEGLECSSASGVERCEVTGCEVGSQDCGCQLDRTCNSGLSCVQGFCAQTTCTPGTKGCNCSAKYTCESNLVCDLTAEVCRQAGECTPGNLGCECDANSACVSGLTCDDGMCQDATCAPGLEGCACLNDTCGQTSEGEALSCVSGVCELSSCPPGQTGCRCKSDASCDDESSVCDSNYCRASECIPGEVGCECLAGSCNAGLKCQDNTVCADQTGKNNGPCYDDNTCSRNNRCDDTVVPAVCVSCDLGTIGCQCNDDDTCSPGLSCLLGHCVGDETVQNRVPPPNPVCYTPCEDNLVDENGEDETRQCVNGYIEGCLDGMECVNGSCVTEGSVADICFEDSDCPTFQLCMQGYCYAECSRDSDCEGGMFCHEKVCRDTCSMDSGGCESGYVCEAQDGDTGYCMKKAAETNVVRTYKTGEMELSTNLIEYTNERVTGKFTLINNSNDYVNFTLRKVEHSALLTTGADDVSNYDGADCSGAACPLWWVEMGQSGRITQDREVIVRVPPKCDEDCPIITVRMANDGAGFNSIRWKGVIEVESDIGSDRVDLTYVGSPQGRWAGTMVYFANFETKGIYTDDNTLGWLDRTDRSNVSGVQNGLIQKWGGFRKNGGGGWLEMRTVLAATQSGQWAWPSVREDCFLDDGACFLYDAGQGAIPRSYVTSLDAAPIPTGVVEFPMAMNIHVPDSSEPGVFTGKIVSDKALHYPGNPAVTLKFDGDPTDGNDCDAKITTACVSNLEMLDVQLNVGARYALAPEETTCGDGFVKQDVPWLIEGFLQDAYQDASSGLYRRSYCHDQRVPFFEADTDEKIAQNINLAQSNPIPNGRLLDRQIELLDGVMIDQSEIFILFRERYPSFIDDEPVTAYGYMVLEREALEIEEEDADNNGTPDAYEGSTPPSSVADSAVASKAVCSDDVLDAVLGSGVSLTQSNAPDVINAIIHGGTPAEASRIKYLYEDATANEEVHYLCEDTGLFDGGPDNTADWGEGFNGPNLDTCITAVNGICEDGATNSTAATCAIGTDVTDCGFRFSDTRVKCPRKSKVIYFTTNASLLPNIHDEACQQTGTCLERLNNWIDNGNPIIKQVEPKWRCEGDSVFCDANELDRRAGKLFYKKDSADLPFLPIHAEIDEAFRYKTRFRSRDGLSSVGFEPSLCEPFSNTTPYCYDAEQIEGIVERTQCLLHIYDAYYDSAQGGLLDEADTLYDYLEENFSFREEPSPYGGLPTTYDGFERLYAELLIMLGDAAYTAAFESRFNLAGSLAASFEGSQFEQDGIDVSGVAGYEMVKLYQAVQYYEMVLNHFYDMGDVIGAALESGSPQTQSNFISSGTVTSYFDRLIRASTQRSRAMSEIVRRYQSFNRADLAAKVAERAYTSTYLESMFLTNLITRFYDISGGSQKPQILIELEKSQLRYRTALVDLTQVYNDITTEVNFFGFPVDYIPFPTLDPGTTTSAESNAFEKILRTANAKLDVARTREQNALSQTRSYETDEASFQAELTRITRTYENQLGDICGTFQGSDGRIYPVTTRYAYLDERLSLIGDPCGFGDNGAIHRAMGELDLAQLEIKRIAVQMQNLFETIEIERQRASDQCDEQLAIADYNYKVGEKVFNLEEDAIAAKEQIDFFVRKADTVAKAIEITQCSQDECISTPVALGLHFATAAATETGIILSQSKARTKREERNQIDLDSAKWNTEKQCDIAEINSDAQMATQMLGLRDLEISAIAADYRISLAIAEVQKLRQQAKRTELEWQETLDTTVNVESAKNDPNIRIYRNDAVINAEISFDDAMQEAYRLTVVYEYYTSTTYINRDQLFLIRMVSSGDYNLENYIYDLKNAFNKFEESYGIPEQRVEVISLRDDIFRVPTLGADGEALSINERSAILREQLSDPGLLNTDGYLAIPFRTNIERLSPLTRNHKIFYVEANIEGNDNGDFLGRLYLRQVGTSMIRTLEDELSYYRFPTRTAVINPFFNGTRQFSQSNELYRSYRLREFPLVNTDWELVLNQRDEVVNQDINLDELIDIKLYVFYTDFTKY